MLTGNDSCIIPGTAGMMTWNIRDAGFEMTLSPEVPGVITRQLPDVLSRFLAKHDLTIDQIPSWCIHPGGPRILAASAEAARLTDTQLDPSLAILRQCGNMSSPTVLFILQEQIRREALAPCVMLGFGPGLNVEMALLR
jgi:predicted naringenin-chalcone synthase